MSEPRKPFNIDVRKLKTHAKPADAQTVESIDRAAEEQGFISREPRRRPGRKPSPRTGQVHAKVLPEVSDAIAEEATRRGVTQGVIIEEAWALYQARQG